MYRFFVNLIEPYSLLCLSAIVGLIVVWTRPAPSRRRLLWVGVPIVLLLCASTPAMVFPILGSLEWAYPPLSQRPETAEAIVVLGGGKRLPDATRHRARLAEDSMIRCEYAAELYRQGRPCPVLVTGGVLDPDRKGPSVAELMRDFLVHSGVAQENVVVEDQAQSTYENALYCKKLLTQHGIESPLLVTDATHMCRARRCFEKQGIAVICAPCRHRATELAFLPGDFLPSSTAVSALDVVAHEYLGLAWYWLRGRV